MSGSYPRETTDDRPDKERAAILHRHLHSIAVSQVESYLAINGGDLLELSPQQLTSCSSNELQCGGTGGCAGSVASLAFTYTQLFGAALESDYPYLSGRQKNHSPF